MQDEARVVAALGEFPLIARLTRELPAPLAPGAAAGLKLGIGDDAAAWAPTPGAWSVITADALVEGVHFRLETTDAYDLGWKSLAVNISDVAAMGAAPRYAVITAGIPGDTTVSLIDELYRGLADIAARYDTLLIGGDVVRAPFLTLSVTVVGETTVRAGDTPVLLRRDAARPGDALAITGAVGASGGGLRLLEARHARGEGGDGGGIGVGGGEPERGADEEALLRAHRRPTPRVAEAATLLRAGVRCAMDLSDGPLSDGQRIAAASGVNVVIEAARVPVAPALARVFPADALHLALAGGEDYELLCAAPPAVLAAAAVALQGEHGLPLTIVGRIEPADAAPSLRVVDAHGAPITLPGGWTHYAAASGQRPE